MLYRLLLAMALSLSSGTYASQEMITNFRSGTKSCLRADSASRTSIYCDDELNGMGLDEVIYEKRRGGRTRRTTIFIVDKVRAPRRVFMSANSVNEERQVGRFTPESNDIDREYHALVMKQVFKWIPEIR